MSVCEHTGLEDLCTPSTPKGGWNSTEKHTNPELSSSDRACMLKMPCSQRSTPKPTLFFFGPCYMTDGILVPWPGILSLHPLQWECKVLTTGCSLIPRFTLNYLDNQGIIHPHIYLPKFCFSSQTFFQRESEWTETSSALSDPHS